MRTLKSLNSLYSLVFRTSGKILEYSMRRDWNDFKSLHSNIAGAREAFEDACELLYNAIYKNEHVSQVRVKQGDGGIDIFVGELGVEPIRVIQCKFFLEGFGNSQKSQIRKSFKTAMSSKKYEVKEWTLCIPRVIDIDENAWWFKWKQKQLTAEGKDKGFIKLTNGNQLINLFKEQGLYNRVFGIEESLKIDEIHNAVVKPKKVSESKGNANNILFNNYSIKNEPYYLHRDSDTQFVDALEIGNIWIFGNSGLGKTALINRNLLQHKIEYCFCDLSPVTIESANDVLNEILFTLEERLNIDRDESESNPIKQISKTLCKSQFDKVTIVVDELSVSNDEVLKSIADSFIQLVAHHGNQSNQDELKFVVSTIADPKNIIQNKSKASDLFQYICCNSWEEYTSQLFDLLTEALGLKISNSKEEIVSSCGNSPRLLKNILKKLVIIKDASPSSVSNAIAMSIEEIVE